MSQDLLIRFPSRRTESRVRVERGALSDLGSFTRRTTGASHIVMVSDVSVAALYADRALRALRKAGLDATLVSVPSGERSKSVRHLVRLWEMLPQLDLDRSGAVVALGGGVVGDLAGFAAATWLRGVPWVCVPTSLMAQVDSSIGGKTAVDLAAGKNLVGAFHQPAGVIVDPDLLATLPARHLRAGLAEVIKTGVAVDATLFTWIERHADAIRSMDPIALAEVVIRSIRAKARVVRADEREREGGGRTALNYGHTLGHALEAALGYRTLLHGEAVSIGMRVAAGLSVRAAGLAPSIRDRQNAMLDDFGLPRYMPALPLEALMTAMRQDKKRRAQGIRWVLTTRLGGASVPRLISNRLVRVALLEAGARA